MYKKIYGRAKNYIDLYLFKKKWRKKNLHNEVFAVNEFQIEKVSVGNYSYGPIEVKTWGNSDEKLEIGNFVSIAQGVKFILGGNHEVNTFTTYPFKVKFFIEKSEAWTKGKIIIKDDVWIATDAIIMSGVTIGQGAIIAAGSVVTKDVQPYSIVGGNPAKFIKYRYSKEIREEMLKINWSEIDLKNIKNVKNELYRELDLETLSKIKSKLFIKNDI